MRKMMPIRIVGKYVWSVWKLWRGGGGFFFYYYMNIMKGGAECVLVCWGGVWF